MTIMVTRPPDYLPGDVLERPDFIAACKKRDLGEMLAIANKRGGAGFTVSHIARRCEMTVSQVQDYIKRGRRALSMDIFERVADGLHISGRMLGISRRPWEKEDEAVEQAPADHAVVDEEGPDTTDTNLLLRPSTPERLTITSPAHLQEILIHLREQWHALVRTDNLLGPRFALAGVLNQITVVEALRSILRDEQRLDVVRLGAKYAESAAWTYEDAGNMAQARYWTSRAMEWAYEGDDERMLAWTIFRRAQQAAATPDAAQAIGLAQAARRNEEKLATPTRAAIRVQEAYGHALDGNEPAAQRLLDEAHTWAASDTVGDAHEGHGSYCTPSYIEIQRANCWLTTGKPKKAIALYEEGLRMLPAVYQRNRAAALSALSVAYMADGQVERAASTAYAALPVAQSAGSRRILAEIKRVGADLAPHRVLPAVAALLDGLDAEDH
jgi:tetratricopeptide (TPR) repeat protein